MTKPTFLRVGVPKNTVRPPTAIAPPTQGSSPASVDEGSVVTYGDNGSTDTHPLNIPSGASVGDGVLYFISSGATAAGGKATDGQINTFPTNAGTQLLFDDSIDEFDPHNYVYWRIVESGDSAGNMVQNDADDIAYVGVLVKANGATLPANPPAVSNDADTTSSNSNPPEVTVSTAGDYAVFATWFGNKGSESTVPTGFTSLAYQKATASGNSPRTHVSYNNEALTTTSNPDAFGYNDAESFSRFSAVTVAISREKAATVAAADHDHVEADITDLAHTTDHGALTGLADDDHPHYFLADGTRQATYVDVSGLTGATAASRYVGATASGAPVSGTFAVGDFIIDQSGSIYICTAAGTPGTWTAVSGGGSDHGALTGLTDDDHTQYVLADGTRAFTGDQSMGSNKLTNVTDPTSAQDAATKAYVDANAGDYYEVIVSGSSPPVAVTNEASDDWLYGLVP